MDLFYEKVAIELEPICQRLIKSIVDPLINHIKANVR